jgi:hypothetical protein
MSLVPLLLTLKLWCIAPGDCIAHDPAAPVSDTCLRTCQPLIPNAAVTIDRDYVPLFRCLEQCADWEKKP